MSRVSKVSDKQWEQYLYELSHSNTPLLICESLKIPVDSLKYKRKNDEEFQEKEQTALEVYSERIYADMAEYCKQYPQLRWKFAEKASEKLKEASAGPTTVNVNQEGGTLLLTGLSADQAYSETQRMLARIEQGQSKQLASSDGNKALLETGSNPSN
jgi:CRISPR/Cas system-associated exonuclease Cas4 (RecB family)